MKTPVFYNPEKLPAIRNNAANSTLEPLYEKWKSQAPDSLIQAIEQFEKTRQLIYDWGNVLRELENTALVYLVEPEPTLADTLVDGIRRMIGYEAWDYFWNDRDQLLSIQRGSMTIKALIFARDALGEAFPDELEDPLVEALIEKGVLPCYHAVSDMDNWKEKPRWRGDHNMDDFYSVNMERYPLFFAANNLRADPTSALGIAAIALMEVDDRATHWLEVALNSASRVLDLFGADGSYFEGISYASYTLRTTLQFLDIHERNGGSLDWVDNEKLSNVIHFMLSMQLGFKGDGTPDVANFSDSGMGVNAGIAFWIGNRTGNPYARFAAEETGQVRFIHEFLYYDPEQPVTEPPAELYNVRNELDWIFCRTGWRTRDAFLAFRGGGPCNHEHADRNSLIYKYNEERLLHDNFKAAYDWRNPGWLLRKTEAHNSVLINGRGQHYVDGSEGTNQSYSYATLIDYRDNGDTVWWTSDATACYHIENYLLFKVLRTVVFIKPDCILILDRVRLRYETQPVAIRFFPDNRDDKAVLSIEEQDAFQVQRPNATLSGRVYSLNGTPHLEKAQLDLPDDLGCFPYLEVQAEPALHHNILTVLTASAANAVPQPPRVVPTDSGWDIERQGFHASIHTRDWRTPAITLSQE